MRLLDQLKKVWERAEEAFDVLSVRERRMLILAILALVGFLLFIATLRISRTESAIQARTSAKLRALEEIRGLAATYKDRRAAQVSVEAALAGSKIRLLSFLDEQATRAGLSLQTQNPRPEMPVPGTSIVESGVEITLTDVKLNRLVDFLNSITLSSNFVRVKYLRVEAHPENGTVTAWVTISAYSLKGS